MNFNRIPFLLKLGLVNTWIALIIGELHVNAFAQIIPDNTLNTNVNQSGNVFNITGGTSVGGNLFHSFSEFSIASGNKAFFDYNVTDISHIISRVTGNKISDINGIIHANGSANLFLINPNGIVFGPNASLNIGGSFIASTADTIEFADGNLFSAKDTQTPPLLSINVPIGLQYGSNVAGIEVQQSNLAVSPNQTLALLGGNVTINGGKLLAPGGQISLGGLVGEGTISLQNIIPSFPASVQRGNVTFTNSAIANVTTTTSGGNITVYSDNLNIAGDSKLLAGIASNSGLSGAIAGDILINATGDISISDKSLIANTVSSSALGNGGNIQITANSLALTSGGRIETITQATGKAGNIEINTNNLDISGFTSDGLFSGILSYSETVNSGATGNILINQNNNPQGTIRLANRGFIATATDSSSNGGSIEVNGKDIILESGGQILTSATNTGSAGDILINGTGTVNINGSSQDFISSPFSVNDDITVLPLDNLSFRTDFNPDIEKSGSGGIPYVSVQRTPDQIASGKTVLGTATDGFDYYSFTVNAPNSRAIFDIDGGNGYSNLPGSLDTMLFLFKPTTGEVIGFSDDSRVASGGSGSLVSQDSYISTLLSAGTYVIGVSEFNAISSSLNLLEGNRIDRGDTYTLHVSLQNHGGITQIPPTILPSNSHDFNPNYGTSSGLVSRSTNSGNTGKITINTPQLTMGSTSEIAATVSGTGKVADITVNARNIDINNGIISNTTRGSGDTGNILINAEDVNLNNSTVIKINSFGQGNTGDIRLNAANVRLLQGAQLDNNTYIHGDTGKIIINARESVLLDGEFNGSTSNIFNIVASPSAVGNAGGIEINTGLLSLNNGASINSTTYGKGNAGDITINARDSVLLNGRANSGRGSGLFNRVRGTGRGDAGDINITTNIFSMTNSAQVFSRTEGIGNAGSTAINAKDIFIDRSTIANSVENGAIGNGGILNFNASNISLTNGSKVTASTAGKGDAGQILIQGNDLVYLNNSQISTAVTSQGIGRGGNIGIKADDLILDNQSAITAATASGQGGDINLKLNDLLLLRRNSQITATAGTGIGAGGDGGNIEINAPFIVAIPSENSDITANAFEGNGGNIKITANSIIGLESRDKLTPFSDITASSELGVDGVVEINTLNVNPNNGLVQLPETLTDPSDQVVAGCAAAKGNSFTIAGRGGLPEDPTGIIRGQTIWRDLQDFSLANEGENTSVVRNQSPITNSQNPQTSILDAQGNAKAGIVEATGFDKDEQGNIRLVAPDTNGSPSGYQASLPNCHQLSSTDSPGIFGLVPTQGTLKNSLSEINASSQTGIQGIVTINNPELDPTSGLVKLPEEVSDSTNQIVVGCAAAQGNSFTITGRVRVLS
ncbi:DVUA0089 family protein [Limnofasciculus baicalensis]|uniref:DVUA0089 family protein n=1 Tax=Limnofasciculus baicalensis BBK-W-15 TaxID=2699891 RepID=A0AAE3GNM3_9CYAN|nr:DVUA0089 family protein [Limnofasciculus baicalensis]MCP2726933.1 DVUA0089 family protein [Limnofasciculus baicalensis BBK-W-15]